MYKLDLLVERHFFHHQIGALIRRKFRVHPWLVDLHTRPLLREA